MKMEEQIPNPYTRRSNNMLPTAMKPLEGKQITSKNLKIMEKKKKEKKEKWLKHLMDQEAAITLATSKKDSNNSSRYQDLYEKHNVKININVTEMVCKHLLP